MNTFIVALFLAGLSVAIYAFVTKDDGSSQNRGGGHGTEAGDRPELK